MCFIKGEDMEEIEYFDNYEQKLLEETLKMCTSFGMLDGTLLSSEDIDGKWKEFAPEYIAEALPDVNTYPEVAIAWAGYLGMAVAKHWDTDWGRHHADKYESFHGSRGFDNMDDHIMADILGYSLDSTEAQQLTNMMRCCAQTAITFIQHEQIESQTTKAFHIFARTVKVQFRIGAALILKKAGYRFQKVNLNDFNGKRFS